MTNRVAGRWIANTPASDERPSIQREVVLYDPFDEYEDIAVDVDDLTDDLLEELTAAGKAVLRAWIEAETAHRIVMRIGAEEPGGPDVLIAAANQAGAQRAGGRPGLFSGANLKFKTTSDDRLPTYYFENAGSTGRLRQQHPQGPLAQIDPVARVSRFFADEDARGPFLAALGASFNDGTPLQVPDHVNQGQAAPFPGASLVEYEVDGNGVVKNAHPSGGRVELVAGDNAAKDLVVAAAFNRITGQ